MSARHAIPALLATAALALGAYSSLDIAPGANAPSVPGCARIAYVEALASTNETGTLALQVAGRPAPVFEEETRYLYATNTVLSDWTNVWRTVVSGGGAVTSRYREYVALTTNEVVSVTTNTALVAVGAVATTNALPTLTCAAGAASLAPTNAFLRMGDTVIRSGTATGPVRIVLEY